MRIGGAGARLNAKAAMFQAASMVPHEHLALLRNLPVAVSWGTYRFVHAGCRPGTPFEQQSDADLTEIREPFLSTPLDSGTIVVHGHSPVREPERSGGRIAVDTACYATGRLTVARIEAGSVRFMCAAGHGRPQQTPGEHRET